ncbi:isochorismatase family protein [Nonomuraea sp. NPDC001684]
MPSATAPAGSVCRTASTAPTSAKRTASSPSTCTCTADRGAPDSSPACPDTGGDGTTLGQEQRSVRARAAVGQARQPGQQVSGAGVPVDPLDGAARPRAIISRRRYSAFYGTDLAAQLSDLKVDQLIVAGPSARCFTWSRTPTLADTFAVPCSTPATCWTARPSSSVPAPTAATAK